MRKLIFLILINISFLGSSQEKRVEEAYWDCAYSTLNDKGEFLKSHIKKYEMYLVEKGYLKDNSPHSYYQLFKSFPTRKSYPSVYNYSLFDSIGINTLEIKKVLPASKVCLEKIKKHSGYEMFIAKMHFVDIVSDNDRDKALEAYIELLTLEDFKLDYYKIKTLLMTQLLNFKVD